MKDRIAKVWVNPDNEINIRILGTARPVNLAKTNLVQVRSLFGSMISLYCGEHAEENLLNEAEDLVVKMEKECLRLKECNKAKDDQIDAMRLKKNDLQKKNHDHNLVAIDLRAQLKNDEKSKNLHDQNVILGSENNKLKDLMDNIGDF